MDQIASLVSALDNESLAPDLNRTLAIDTGKIRKVEEQIVISLRTEEDALILGV